MAVFLLTGATALAVTGQLNQLPGKAGCISETGSSGACADGKALNGATSVAVSSDGKSVYATGGLSDAVATFNRNSTSDAITQLSGTAGCVSQNGSSGQCTDGRGLDGAQSVAVSPDARNVYVASRVSDGVASFIRDTTTGALTHFSGALGCSTQTGSGGECITVGKALDGARSLAVSLDGRNLYVASENSDAVANFSRWIGTGAQDPPYGSIAQFGGTHFCVSETGSNGQCVDGKALDGASSVTVSPDDKNVYVTSSEGVAIFRRAALGEPTQLVGPSGQAGCWTETGSGGACRDGRALQTALSVAVSPDGKNVYVAGFSGVAAFKRDITSGALMQLAGSAGCVTETGSGGECLDGKALINPEGIAVSPDGKSVYVASYGSDSIAVFNRNATNGALAQLAGTAGCVSQTGSSGQCFDGKALDGAVSVTVSTDSTGVYTGAFESDALAVFARESLP